MDGTLCLREVVAELARRGWRLLKTEPIGSGSGARLARLHVVDDRGRPTPLIVKRPAPPAREVDFYEHVLPHFPDYAPVPLGIFPAPVSALLLPDLGPSLKARWAALHPSAQAALALDLARFLADFHETGRHLPATARRQVPPYPRDSSRRWAQRALDALAELATAGRLDPRRVDALGAMAGEVYGSRGEFCAGAAAVLHGDPHFANLCSPGPGRWALIDWEYLEIGPAVRDLTVLLLDVADETLHPTMRAAWAERLLAHGWTPAALGSEALYATAFFDNTLMMVGFEIDQATARNCPWAAIQPLVERRLRWLEHAFRFLG